MLKIFYITILTFFILSLPSCVSDLELISQDVYLAKPSNPNTKTYLGTLINIKPSNFSNAIFRFRLGYVKAKNQGTWVVRTVYSGYVIRLYINKLEFFVDNDRYPTFEFNSIPKPFRAVGYPFENKNYYEENYFVITHKLCKALLKTNQVSIELAGLDYFIVGDLENKDFQKLKNFIDYIDSKVLSPK